MDLSFTTAQIAEIVKPISTRGSTNLPVRGIASLGEARAGDLTFLGNPKYKPEVAATAASVVLLPADYEGEPKPGQLFIIVKNPSVAIAQLCARVEQLLWPKPAPGIHPSAIIDPGANIAASASIGPLCVIESGAVIGERAHIEAQCFVGRNARIGDDCWIKTGARIASECELRNRVRLQSNVVVGSDGFGYELVGGRHEKVPQVGNVVIHDDVEVGAGTTIDRARFSRTEIGEGTKIDNLVQIAHNVIIGKHCLVCAQTGISGSTVLEDYVVLAGQVGLGGHIRVGKGAVLTAQAGAAGDVPAGAKLKGTPGTPYMLEQRINILRQRLPELFQRVGELEKQFKNSASA
ncbi:UDP-3-O-[3-hydroxymyristoyl] glucosamine N-acyltransferase [Ereboglobus sp. PH5-10]|uniref:UDP-3-O-(3-hydroxymyristoyl)glucosamine N-acyltransferase n=1 Tax=Ereboglobus sp. PH5-10 TaxID=2940629 RepID=UPI00240753D9|nr:UDP-3-O-(3-hydroxymyristoyl)glucosamine N-acyltransferase [Ereboglobus sp. PH5-10]MDF9826420.1 UDP-3-O-[3-hydroxymyristoyl] glucosamine N-acyltransferase [Ereboglobus sp. PH5-10]